MKLVIAAGRIIHGRRGHSNYSSPVTLDYGFKFVSAVRFLSDQLSLFRGRSKPCVAVMLVENKTVAKKKKVDNILSRLRHEMKSQEFLKVSKGHECRHQIAWQPGQRLLKQITQLVELGVYPLGTTHITGIKAHASPSHISLVLYQINRGIES